MKKDGNTKQLTVLVVRDYIKKYGKQESKK